MLSKSADRLNSRLKLLCWTLWYLSGSVSLLMLVSTDLLSSASVAFEAKQLIYFAAALLGHYGSLAGLLWLLLIVPMILVFPYEMLIKSLLVTISVLALLALMLDVQIYSLYRFHINGVLLKLAIQDRGREIFVFSTQEWMNAGLAVFAVVLVHILLSVAVNRRIERARVRSARGWLAALLVLFSFAASHTVHAWSDAHYSRYITSLTQYIPLYRPATAKSFLHKRGWVDAEIARQEAQMRPFSSEVEVGRDLDYPKSALRCSGVDQGREELNVLTIVIDSWRADELDTVASPYLMALSEGPQSLKFTEHFSGGNSTQAGIFSLFYGLPSLYWQSMADSATAPVLMNALQSANYELGVFASAVLTHPAFDRTVFSGVQDLRLSSEGETPWQRDKSVNADWDHFLNTRDDKRPFFGFLFYDAPHGFSYPDTFQSPYQQVWQQIDRSKLDSDFDPLPYFNRHKTAVRYVDSLVRQVVEDLKQRGLFNNTLIVVTSDHGEEFNDSGLNYWGHGSNYTRAQLQVPFFLRWPGKQGRVFDHRTSHMDVAPTLLSLLLGCENPSSDYSQGRNLLEQQSWAWMVAGSYYNQAVLFEDSILVTYPSGNYEVLTPNYRKPEKTDINPELLHGVLTEMHQFLQ